VTAPVWRLITDDNASASFGLAADEYLAEQVGLRASAPVLRLYTYRSHCALVGRHQSVESEINLDFCESHGIAINRRPTGGGAIIMGADQLGIALIIRPEASHGAHHRLRELFTRFSQGIVVGLENLGIHATFGGKNDVEVQRRKIAGLGICRDNAGGLLCHASVLVDLDLELMLRVLRTPFEKISDKAIATVAQRVTTTRRELGTYVSLEEVRAAIRDGFAGHFGSSLMPGEFSLEEIAGIRQLERAKYLIREWIEAKPAPAGESGSARVKTPGGLLNVQLTLAGDVIQAIYLTGDFFADDESVNALERLLRWSPVQAVEGKVLEFCADAPHAFENIAPSDLTRAVTRAIERARHKEQAREPYGCFVNP
jgi:lipoate-protein ligase A